MLLRTAYRFLWNSRCPFVTKTVKIRRMSHAPGDVALPPKPIPPNDSDCCNSGCEICVTDIYQQELKIWEEECNSLLLAKAPRSSLSPNTYMKCPLIALEQLTHNTFIFTFDSKGYVQMLPGQHLILREYIDGAAVTRQYTPLTVPEATNHSFTIMIKSYDEGKVTSHIKNRWKIGDDVEWRGPHGSFQHKPNKYMKYLMLAAGTGIAPMLRVAQSIVANDNDITTIKLVYACKCYEEVLLKEELKKLAQHWNFTYTTYLNHDPDGERKKGYGENVIARKLDSHDISSQLSNLQSTRVLISGTRQFDLAMIENCQTLQVPSENVYKF